MSVALKLRLARARLEPGAETAAKLLEDASRELDTGLAELREIARGLHPGDPRRPRPRSARSRRSPRGCRCRWSSRSGSTERLPGDVEATAYYIVSEALTNVTKHAEASGAQCRVRRDGDVLRCEVSDDGRGGADAAGGTGILGLRDRAEAAGGTLTLISPPGSGTVVSAMLPLPA